jgi:hypothetical protein
MLAHARDWVNPEVETGFLYRRSSLNLDRENGCIRGIAQVYSQVVVR